MTPLYSKETERRAISILSSGINNHPPKIKDETAILIGLIENGNEGMRLLEELTTHQQDSREGRAGYFEGGISRREKTSDGFNLRKSRADA